jgi:2-polyprenyl-6-methoxyphenol hydroxylase-like FAD-dependent oxidoreductase
MSDPPADSAIAIIGAGSAGIGTAIQLRRAGSRSFTIFERAGTNVVSGALSLTAGALILLAAGTRSRRASVPRG